MLDYGSPGGRATSPRLANRTYRRNIALLPFFFYLYKKQTVNRGESVDKNGMRIETFSVLTD